MSFTDWKHPEPPRYLSAKEQERFAVNAKYYIENGRGFTICRTTNKSGFVYAASYKKEMIGLFNDLNQAKKFCSVYEKEIKKQGNDNGKFKKYKSALSS